MQRLARLPSDSSAAARPAKPLARRDAGAAVTNAETGDRAVAARRVPARDRRRNRAGAQNAESGRARARLLAPDGTRALATPHSERLEIVRAGRAARPAKPRRAEPRPLPSCERSG